MPVSFVAGPKPVKPAEILNVTVRWDDPSMTFNQTAYTFGGSGPVTGVGAFRMNGWFDTSQKSGPFGVAMRNTMLDSVKAHSAEFATMGTNASESDLKILTNPTKGAPKDGSWIIAIDRKGTSADQVIRGNLDDQLPQSIQDVLKSARELFWATK